MYGVIASFSRIDPLVDKSENLLCFSFDFDDFRSPFVGRGDRGEGRSGG